MYKNLYTWLIAIVSLCYLVSVPAFADSEKSYPNRPITLVVPVPAGSDSDIVARLLAQGMSQSLKQTVIVENRPGAGGQIAMKHVSVSKADGYTLGAPYQASITLIPAIRKVPPYDANTDFTPIGRYGSFTVSIVVPADSPIKSLDQLISMAKSQPGKLAFSSFGVGSGGHLTGAMLNSIAGIDLVHIPYASSSDAGMALLRKEVDLAVLGDATAAKLLREGQARILARPTSERSPLFPGVPTLTEQGIALKTDGWVGLVGPAKLDPGIVKILENAVQDAAKVPGVKEKLANMGVQLNPSDAPTYAKIIKETAIMWAKAVEVAKIEKN